MRLSHLRPAPRSSQKLIRNTGQQQLQQPTRRGGRHRQPDDQVRRVIQITSAPPEWPHAVRLGRETSQPRTLRGWIRLGLVEAPRSPDAQDPRSHPPARRSRARLVCPRYVVLASSRVIVVTGYLGESLDRDSVVAFIRTHGDGVLSTLGPDGSPQSAYLTLTVTDRGELVLDAREASRKVANLRQDSRVAVVVGGADGVTLQAEGLADFPAGDEWQRCADAYQEAFPRFASSLHDPAIVVVRVRIVWARLSDFRSPTAVLRETGPI